MGMLLNNVKRSNSTWLLAYSTYAWIYICTHNVNQHIHCYMYRNTVYHDFWSSNITSDPVIQI